MSESDLSSRLVTKMQRLDPKRVENRLGKGTPDLNYRNGWIELKWNKHWPVKPETPVPVSRNHPLTKEQKVWLERRWRKKGLCFVLLCCGDEYLLWAGADVQPLGSLNKQSLIDTSIAYWDRGLRYQEFERILTSPHSEVQKLRRKKNLFKPWE